MIARLFSLKSKKKSPPKLKYHVLYASVVHHCVLQWQNKHPSHCRKKDIFQSYSFTRQLTQLHSWSLKSPLPNLAEEFLLTLC